jgi:hypothetical protein
MPNACNYSREQGEVGDLVERLYVRTAWNILGAIRTCAFENAASSWASDWQPAYCLCSREKGFFGKGQPNDTQSSAQLNRCLQVIDRTGRPQYAKISTITTGATCYMEEIRKNV